MNFKIMLAQLRGWPEKCDFCEDSKTLEELEPEEGGMWVCHSCQARWEKEEKEKPDEQH